MIGASWSCATTREVRGGVAVRVGRAGAAPRPTRARGGGSNQGFCAAAGRTTTPAIERCFVDVCVDAAPAWPSYAGVARRRRRGRDGGDQKRPRVPRPRRRRATLANLRWRCAYRKTA